MDVLLCQSYMGPRSGEPLVFPLGLAYLASIIKEKHDVDCWDPNVSENPMKDFKQILEKNSPDVVGLSLRNIDSAFSYNVRFYYPFFVYMVKLVKEVLPSCKLVVGGPGFSIFAEEIMKRNPEIDFGIVAEGEYSFSELLENLNHPEKVKNLMFRRDGKLFYTGKGEWLDFESLPPPSMELFNLNMYKKNRFSMGIQTKRGCSFNCTYCPNRIITGEYFRLRSPKRVADDIEELVNKYGFDSFFFVDSVFNYPLSHTRAIMNEIIKRKLNVVWQAEFRPDFLNTSFTQEAIRAGCVLFSMSPDGASNEALKFLGKDFTVSTIDKSIDLAKKVENANVLFNFLYDLPHDNSRHAYGLLRIFLKIQQKLNDGTCRLSLTKIRILPYTLIYEIALRQGKITENTDLLHPIHYNVSSPMSFEKIIPNFVRLAMMAKDNIAKYFNREKMFL